MTSGAALLTQITDLRAALHDIDNIDDVADPAELIDLITGLEDLKSTACAAQARASELERRVKQLTYQLAPAAFVKRRTHAETDRHVTLRPAPDAMTYLTALLPVEHGVAAWKALTDHAATRHAAGDQRSKGQLM